MVLPYVPDGCLEQFSVSVLCLAVTEIRLKGIYFCSVSFFAWLVYVSHLWAEYKSLVYDKLHI